MCRARVLVTCQRATTAEKNQRGARRETLLGTSGNAARYVGERRAARQETLRVTSLGHGCLNVFSNVRKVSCALRPFTAGYSITGTGLHTGH